MGAQYSDAAFNVMKRLSPRRNTSEAETLEGLVAEQLEHFGIAADSEFGEVLSRITTRLYENHADIRAMWEITMRELAGLNQGDKIAQFNAKKFLSFQLAKLLDHVQNPTRKSYQSLGYSNATQSAKGPYSVFDNVTAIFSATPVITRTATYKGKDLLLEIYSRLLNPTSVSLANFIVDLEAGPYAGEYFAWNFNSGMAAIDGALSHLIGRNDVLICSRNLYGGAHQLIHDWYARKGNLNIGVKSFDGFEVTDFLQCWEEVKLEYADRFEAGRKAYLYLESPCNPHGYVLDVPKICKEAHRLGVRVLLDATVGTPFLFRPLQRENAAERPDFVIHSYTKDLSGTGSMIAGGVIGRNEDMFMPKGECVGAHRWDETMFWNVYYVKGAFLNADAAFEVIQGMRTLTGRMLSKCINTAFLAHFFAAHPQIIVNSNALQDNPNAELLNELSHYGCPVPLFTIEIDGIPREAFHRFFDALSPTFAHMISLGQSNTIVNCPALTTHSELDEYALQKVGIAPTTIRIAVGDEDASDLAAHFIHAAELCIDPMMPGFSKKFLNAKAIDALSEKCYLDIHKRYIQSKRREISK